MKSKYLYLSVNALSFVVPFLLSFYRKASFAKKWKFVLPAILAAAIIFVAWDAIFSALGIWGFNDRYTVGSNILGIPIEEALFFVCIPYACLFIYFALNQLIERDHLFVHQELISSAIIVVLLIFGAYHMDRLYTGITFLFAAMALAFVWLKLRMRFLSRFYFAFGVLLIPFFIVNGFLTGMFTDEPVVWYSDEQILGIRIGTVPVEDFVFGMLLLLIPITIWEKLEEWRGA